MRKIMLSFGFGTGSQHMNWCDEDLYGHVSLQLGLNVGGDGNAARRLGLKYIADFF